MKGSKGLQVASFILLVTQLASINSAGQNSLLRTALEPASGVKDDSVSPTSNLVQPNERKSVLEPIAPEPKALSTRNPRKLGLIDRAYLDAFTILNDQNSCSQFFGGRNAILPLTEMVLRLKPRYLEREIAIRMSGETTSVQSHLTGFAFRIFEKAEVNMAGSFFHSPSPTERKVSITPTYAPNTRETRVLVLLHELGHLVKGADKRWVLPDDGNDPGLSLRNTQRVVSVCSDQISALARLKAEEELERTTLVAQTTGIVP